METQSSPNPYTKDSVLDSKYLNPEYLFNEGVDLVSEGAPKVFQWKNVGGFNSILFYFAIFFITLILYCGIRLLEIRRKEHKHLRHEIAEYAHHQAELAKKKREGEGMSTNPRWRQVLEYVFSVNAADWRLAVIEADSMLEALMDQLGFKGETLGDKLKSASQESFRSLTTAWEVHTVRNRIAHEGLDFNLSQHEAKRVIALYEQIFREFGYI